MTIKINVVPTGQIKKVNEKTFKKLQNKGIIYYDSEFNYPAMGDGMYCIDEDNIKALKPSKKK